jgi:hypothetical protein
MIEDYADYDNIEGDYVNHDERLDAMLAETHRQGDFNFHGTSPNQLISSRS